MRRSFLPVVIALVAACGRDRAPARTSPEASVAPESPSAHGGGPVHAPPVVEVAGAGERRAALVDTLERAGAVRDPRVLQAMRAVPRHLFVGNASVAEAYSDRALAIGYGQTISQPTVVGMMTAALDLRGHERVLEIGTGSGYQAAILSLLAAEVYSIEIVVPLAHGARARLTELGYRVNVRAGDGYLGWPDAAPFDRIIITAAPPEVPAALVDQLAEGGVMVLPVGPEHGAQELVRLHKVKGKLRRENLGPVLFVPMVHP